jgi:hypothetical protein
MVVAAEMLTDLGEEGGRDPLGDRDAICRA